MTRIWESPTARRSVPLVTGVEVLGQRGGLARLPTALMAPHRSRQRHHEAAPIRAPSGTTTVGGLDWVNKTAHEALRSSAR